jgi:hypothetical protein
LELTWPKVAQLNASSEGMDGSELAFLPSSPCPKRPKKSKGKHEPSIPGLLTSPSLGFNNRYGSVKPIPIHMPKPGGSTQGRPDKRRTQAGEGTRWPTPSGLRLIRWDCFQSRTRKIWWWCHTRQRRTPKGRGTPQTPLLQEQGKPLPLEPPKSLLQPAVPVGWDKRHRQAQHLPIAYRRPSATWVQRRRGRRMWRWQRGSCDAESMGDVLAPLTYIHI